MSNDYTNLGQQQQDIQKDIVEMFAPEDEGLLQTLSAAKEVGLPEIQISPIQGKFLQFLAVTTNARKILEIGSLAGYSGIWLARALPLGGRLITLEISPKHAEVVRNSFAKAGVSDRTEVRVGKAIDTLPQLLSEAPFDLIFIDADKPSYPSYLDWALRLSRPGSIIVGDNCIWSGKALHAPANPDQDASAAALFEFNRLVSTNPRLTSLALTMDNDYTDGFTFAVVRPEDQ